MQCSHIIRTVIKIGDYGNKKGTRLAQRHTDVFIDSEVKGIDHLMTDKWLCQITDSALTLLNVSESKSIEIAITDDKTMRDLNLRHLGIDSTTDVLSFPNINSPNTDLLSTEKAQDKYKFIGEVVISSPEAGRQSLDKGISFTQEIAFLLGHGILHLLGHDHETEDERIEMEIAHRKILLAMLGKSGMSIEVKYPA